MFAKDSHAQPDRSRRGPRPADPGARGERGSCRRQDRARRAERYRRPVSTIPLRAAASLAAGIVDLGAGAPDVARRHLEDAVDLYVASGAPFELGRARIELARALVALARIQDARQEAQRALSMLSELHAELEMSGARSFLDSFPEADAGVPKARSENDAGLTSREIEYFVWSPTDSTIRSSPTRCL